MLTTLSPDGKDAHRICRRVPAPGGEAAERVTVKLMIHSCENNSWVLESAAMSTAKTLYTTNEAAALLDVTPARVRQMVARGEIASEKMGRDRFITAEAIEEARRRKTTPGPAPSAPKPQAGSGTPATPKLGTIETQTRTTRRLSQSVKREADREMGDATKGGKR
jgi:excisionase family DNA binding protein